MKRTSAVVFSLVLLIALAACGGDDGDDDASASTSEAPATTDESAGDADEGGPGGVCAEEDALTALDDALSGDVPDFEAASAAIDELASADDGALEAPLETLGDGVDRVSDALDGVDLSDDVAVGEALADVEEEDRAAIASASDEIQAYVSDTCGLTIGTDSTTDSSSGSSEAGEADPPPAIDDAELEAFAQECFDGSGGACDDLYFRAEVGSAEEEYGNTCGGRFDSSPGLCATVIGE